MTAKKTVEKKNSSPRERQKKKLTLKREPPKEQTSDPKEQTSDPKETTSPEIDSEIQPSRKKSPEEGRQPKRKTTAPKRTLKPFERLKFVPYISIDEFEVDTQYFLTAVYEDIERAAVELPGCIEVVIYDLSIRVEQRQKCKDELKKVEGTVYLDMRRGETFEFKYGSKPSEAGLNAAVTQDEEVIALKDELTAYEREVTYLRGLSDNLRMRLDFLRTCEATRRRLMPSGTE